MNIITNFKDLEGKEIVFTHFPQFSNKQVIATKDNCIFISNVVLDEDEWGYLKQEQVIMHPNQVINFLDSDEGKYIREKLIKLGIFNFEEYKERQKKKCKDELEKFRLELEKFRLEKEKRELEEYKRLKEKFEGDKWKGIIVEKRRKSFAKKYKELFGVDFDFSTCNNSDRVIVLNYYGVKSEWL